MFRLIRNWIENTFLLIGEDVRRDRWVRRTQEAVRRAAR